MHKFLQLLKTDPFFLDEASDVFVNWPRHQIRFYGDTPNASVLPHERNLVPLHTDTLHVEPTFANTAV